MQLSYSRVSTYEKCPYQFKLRYKDGLQTIFNCDPSNPLIVGTALHTGIEKDVETAIKEYYGAFPIINDMHVTEAMKLEYLIPKVKAMLPTGQHEVHIDTPDFQGFIDLLVPAENVEFSPMGSKFSISDNLFDIYDFKYSNNVENYMQSAQLHLYKYFFELTNPGKRIRNLYFVFVPKCNMRIKYANKTNKRDETIQEFRKRCIADLQSKEIQIKRVDYDHNKVIEYLIQAKHCIEDTEYIKNSNRLCDWCEYQKYCEEGVDYMLLPENVRRDITANVEPDMWIYADSYVGKSTFVDGIEDLLFINTDGNTDNTTSPVVRVKNEITMNGRLKETTLAWESFKELIGELEKKDNTFKVIALDLIEDLYEHCRLFVYDKLNIEHEQDAGFGKGWDIVKTEFLSTLKRLKNIGYRLIFISKEISKEINYKGGAKVTTYAPNIPDKVANVITGMVDLTVRAYMDNKGRYLQLAKTENVFGGGRFNFVNDKCELNLNAFENELRLAQGGKISTTEEKPVETEEENATTETVVEEPKRTRRTRRNREDN